MLTEKQYAERLGVHVGTVRTWINAGELRAVNVSKNANSRKKRYRITPKAADEFERRRMNAPPPEPQGKRLPKIDQPRYRH